MNMYTMPRRGVYTYRTRNFDGTFNTYWLTVDVLGESDKCYMVRVKVPVGGHKAGETMRVRRHNVKLHDVPQTVRPVRQAEHDYSGAWWNN